MIFGLKDEPQFMFNNEVRARLLDFVARGESSSPLPLPLSLSPLVLALTLASFYPSSCTTYIRISRPTRSVPLASVVQPSVSSASRLDGISSSHLLYLRPSISSGSLPPPSDSSWAWIYVRSGSFESLPLQTASTTSR